MSESDEFVFNDKFTSKLYKVKISTVAAGKEGETEKAETRHKVCVLCTPLSVFV